MGKEITPYPNIQCGKGERYFFLFFFFYEFTFGNHMVNLWKGWGGDGVGDWVGLIEHKM